MCFNGGECVYKELCNCSRFNASGPRCQTGVLGGNRMDFCNCMQVPTAEKNYFCLKVPSSSGIFPSLSFLWCCIALHYISIQIKSKQQQYFTSDSPFVSVQHRCWKRSYMPNMGSISLWNFWWTLFLFFWEIHICTCETHWIRWAEFFYTGRGLRFYIPFYCCRTCWCTNVRRLKVTWDGSTGGSRM